MHQSMDPKVLNSDPKLPPYSLRRSLTFDTKLGVNDFPGADDLTDHLCDLRHRYPGRLIQRGTSVSARLMMKWGHPRNQKCVLMLNVGKKRSEKLSITYFGLMGHEIAVLKSTMESTPDLAAGYELREPNQAGTCDIVVVNQDSQLAISWWKNNRKRNPSAVPMFVTNSRQTPDNSAYCKRPFSPSFLQAAFQDFIKKNQPLTQQSSQS